jgi:hypothetical protein
LASVDSSGSRLWRPGPIGPVPDGRTGF